MRRDLPELRSATLAPGRLAWRESGQGPALVLVHGIGGYSASWQPQFRDFGDTHRVIAWDAPGYGGSDLLGAGARAADYADALAALLDHLGITSAHLVGHSLGAVFVASLCGKRPGLAQSVSFLHPVTGGGVLPPEERERVRLGRIADLKTLGARGFAEQRGSAILGSAAPADDRAYAIGVMADVPEAGYLAAWDAMCAADIFADLDAIRCPAFVMTGSEDPVSPEATSRAIAARIPGAMFEVVPGLGHYGSLEAPDTVRRMLRAIPAR